MLDEKQQILRKIRVDDVAQNQTAARVSKRSPFKTALVPRDNQSPDERRDNQQRKKTVSPDEQKHQRREPDIFALEKQINSDHRNNNRQRRRFSHVHPVKKRIRAGDERAEPKQKIIDLIVKEQPVNRKNRQTRVENRCHFRRHYRLEKP